MIYEIALDRGFESDKMGKIKNSCIKEYEMPIFEYKCADCGKITEVLVKSAQSVKPVCEHCGSKKTQKLFSTFAPQVKESAPKSDCRSCSNNACPYAGET